MQIFEMDPKWLNVSRQHWINASVRPGHGLKSPILGGLVADLLALFPKPGEPTHSERPVILHDGKGVDWHAHPEHLIIYYPFSHSAALKIVELDGQAISFKPVQNTAVYLVPGTLHAVEKNAHSLARISLALRWQTAAV